MILRGILDNSLSGQLCIRGFANIKDLASLSEADYTYQRSPIEGREDILNFLENETYLFFPEIILSYKIKHSFQGKTGDIPPLQKLRSGMKYKSNVDNTAFNIKKSKFNDKEILVVEMLLSGDDRVFQRIDGNHRLKAAEEANNSKVDSMDVPFCIILGEEFYEGNVPQENRNTTEFNKALKVYFHNINTKTIPLTSEENLKVIIDGTTVFSDDEVLNILGKEGYLTRLFLNKYPLDTWGNFFITKIIRSSLKRIFQLILKDELFVQKKDDDLVKQIFNAFNYTISLFNENEELKDSKNIWLFKTLIFYKITQNKQTVTQFLAWVFQNRLHEVKEIITESVINIFNGIYSKEIEVFVAMPYFGDEQVESHSAIYKSVIDEIKLLYKVNIKLHKPMIHKGATFDMVKDIFEKINNCGIFISNITNNNPNVTYEMGWARALKIPVIIIKEESAEEPKSDYRNDVYFTYKKDALEATLKKLIKTHIIAVLNNHYGYAIPEKVE